MNRAIDALMKHLKGISEEDSYIAEVSENLYSLTVKRFFGGRKDAEEDISFLYGVSHDDSVTDKDIDYLEKRFVYEQMKAEKRFKKKHIGSDHEISDSEDEEEDIFDPEQFSLKTPKDIFMDKKFGDALLMGNDRGGIKKEPFNTFCCMVSDLYKLPSRMKKQESK